LVDASVEEAGGGGPGSFDRADGFFFGLVEHGVTIGEVGELGFDGGAAAQTPGGSGDFGDEGFFEKGVGVELEDHSFAESAVNVVLVGFDVVLAGVEPEGDGVA
jgi:hypothetical protein